MARSLFIFTALLVVIWLFMEFWESPPEAFLKQKATTGETPKASVYMNDTDTRQFNKEGALEYLLTTSRSEHYAKAKRFDLTNPKVTAHQPDQPPWQLTANRGVITKGSDLVELHGDVIAWQAIPRGGKKELKTSKLLFYPDKKYAETDKKVTLSLPGSRMTGVGMQAELSKGQYELLSKVKGTVDAK